MKMLYARLTYWDTMSTYARMCHTGKTILLVQGKCGQLLLCREAVGALPGFAVLQAHMWRQSSRQLAIQCRKTLRDICAVAWNSTVSCARVSRQDEMTLSRAAPHVGKDSRANGYREACALEGVLFLTVPGANPSCA